MTQEQILSNLTRGSLFQGSPNSTYGRMLFDRKIEDYGNQTDRTRKEINYHYHNGEDIGISVRSTVAGVIGSTVKIHCRTEDGNVNDSYEDLLEEHGEAKNFEITERWDIDDGLRNIVAFLTLQGGIIVREHFNTTWKIPYRLEILGVDKINATKNDREKRIKNGIQTDKYGRVTGIHLYDDETPSNNLTASSTLYTMENMTYYIDTWASLSQYTAVSRFVTILQTLDGMSQYTMAEIMAATDRSKNGIFWHTDLYETIAKQINDIASTLPAQEESLNILKKVIEDIAASQGVGRRGVIPTPKEDTISVVENKSASVYQGLSKSSERKMAASMGGSQVTTYKDIAEGNFSSIKMAGALDERDLKIKFEVIKKRIIKPYLDKLFEIGVQIGRIPLSRKEYFANQRKYHKFDILRTSRSVMSEKDEAMANKTNLESGMALLSKTYAEKDGSDYYEDMIRDAKTKIQIAEDIDKLWENSSSTRPEEKITPIDNTNTKDVTINEN